ncbi:MAG: hypothetical protein AB7U95_33025 [Reyranella sp.]
MDQFWQDALDYLTAKKLVDDIVVAPDAFRYMLTTAKTYGETNPGDAASVAALVLHKGLFEELDRPFLKTALSKLRPSFANEVFIVLTAQGEVLDASSPHVSKLADIRRWAEGAELPGGDPPSLREPAITDFRFFATDGRYLDPLNISQSRGQVYSQNNEDGILAEICQRIGLDRGTFLEIGIGNGLQNNTRFLLEQGWAGTWVEGVKNAAKARTTFAEHVAAGNLRMIGSHVTAENINHLLDNERIPMEIDVICLDIDQNTTHVWRALNRRARINCVEYNASLPPSLDVEVAYDPRATWDGSNWWGGSLKTVENIGRSKGMKLVGCDLLGINAFLVANDDVKDRFRAPFTAENHYEAPKYHLLGHLGHPPSRQPRRWSVKKN